MLAAMLLPYTCGTMAEDLSSMEKLRPVPKTSMRGDGTDARRWAVHPMPGMNGLLVFHLQYRRVMKLSS